jgi:hypothetical protein
VTADAGDTFAGHADEPGTFELKSLSLVVEGLDAEGGVGGDGEVGGAVGLDGDRAEDAFDIPGAIGAEGTIETAHAAFAEVVFDDAEVVDGAAGDAVETGPGVDIGDEGGGLVGVGVDTVLEDGWSGLGFEGGGPEDGGAFVLVDEGEIIEGIDEVETPEGVGVGFGGDEVIAGVEGGGHEELREAEGLEDQTVADDGIDGLAAAGEFVEDTEVIASALGGIKEEESAGAGDIVVAAGDADDLGDGAGDRFGVEEGAGEPGTATAEFALVGAVGVHVEEEPGIGVGLVGVLPALVEDAAIGEEGGAPIAVLFERELPGLAVVWIETVEAGHGVAAEETGESLVGGGGGEEEVIVGEVTGVEMGDILAMVGGDLAGGGFAEVQFPEAPVFFLFAVAGEKDAVGVEVEDGIDKSIAVIGMEEGDEAGLGAEIGEGGEGIAELALAGEGIGGGPIGRADAEIAAFGASGIGAGDAVEDEDAVEIEEGIGEESFAGEGLEVGLKGGRRGAVGEGLFEEGQALEEGVSVGIILSEGGDEILDGEAEIGRMDIGGDRAGVGVVGGFEGASVGAVEGPTGGEGVTGFDAEADQVREVVGALEAEGMFAAGETEMGGDFPGGAAGVPGTGGGAAGVALGLPIEGEAHRAGGIGGVTEVEGDSVVVGEVEIVFDEGGGHAAEGDHGIGIGPILGEDLEVAAVEGPGGDGEGMGRMGIRGSRGTRVGGVGGQGGGGGGQGEGSGQQDE